MRDIKLIMLFTAMFSCFQAAAQINFTLNGYIRDASNGEMLIGATVFITELKNGAATNVYGFYSITLPAGDYDVEYRYLGFETVVRKVTLDRNVRLDMELASESVQVDEIVITADQADENLNSVEMSVNQMDINTIKKIPAFLGEADVLKSIQFLPGVTSVGEGSSGFNVRGGNVGQNLVLLDEAPVYNSSHLLGFFSIFNPDVVKDIKLYKGGIPPRYGGRLASVLDIRMKEGNNKAFEASGGVGTIFSRLTLEAPIVKDKASFVVAGRRSYIDLLARPFTDVLDEGGALNFYDVTAKVNYDINAKNRIFLSGFFGRDVFRFDERQGFNWGSRTGTLRWNHLFNDKLFSNFTFFYSNYNYELSFGEDARDAFDWDSKISTLNVKPELTYFINTRNELTFGGEAILYDFEPANAVGVSNGEAVDVSVETKRAVEAAAYISNEQKVSDRLTLQYGLRYSYYLYLGPGPVYEFLEAEETGLRREVSDVTQAEDWEVIETYNNFEPRVGFRYQLNATTSIKGSYNRLAQYIHLISNTTASNPLDVWTPSTNNIKPQVGEQFALGLFKNLRDNEIETSVEVYYRPTENQVDYIDGADLLINTLLEGDLLTGEGEAYGAEFQVKKNYGKLTGWVSYTLGRTELTVEGINNGEAYPTRFDQRHNLKIAGFYNLNDRWSFSANFTYLSGTPTTFFTSRYELDALDLVIPHNDNNARNNVRIPDYHRLDVSATLQGKKIKKGRERKNRDYWVFSIYNLYGRRNPFSIFFSQNSDVRFAEGVPKETQANQVSIIGSIVPAISYNFTF